MAGRDVMVILPDLPDLTSGDIDDLIDAADPTGAALAPDRHGLGTNAVALRAGTPFAFHFGPASLAAHRAATPGGARIINTPGLRLDIDTPEDWALARSPKSPAEVLASASEDPR